MMRWILPAIVLALAVVAVGCGDDDGGGGTPATSTAVFVTPRPASPDAARTPGPVTGANMLQDPGFEEGGTGWFSLEPTAGFEISDLRAKSGDNSALLRMRDAADSRGIKVYYLVQEVSPDVWPDVVRGSYLVESWAPGAEIQYVQFVVQAWNAANLPSEFTNWQMRYPLAGIDEPAYQFRNARFKMLGTGEPRTGEWIDFEANIRADFEEAWGVVPEDFEKIRVLFEVRWEQKTPGDPASADVYWDDLYMGPAQLASR
jgi:hypothetical protein